MTGACECTESKALPQLIPAEEAAEYLFLKRETVVIKCRRGELPAVKVGHRWFVHVARLADMVEAQASGGKVGRHAD